MCHHHRFRGHYYTFRRLADFHLEVESRRAAHFQGQVRSLGGAESVRRRRNGVSGTGCDISEGKRARVVCSRRQRARQRSAADFHFRAGNGGTGRIRHSSGDRAGRLLR